MIQSSINLFGLSVLLEQPSQNPLPSDPQKFSGHTCLSGTSSLSGTSMSSKPFGFEMFSGSSPGVDDLLSLHDQTVLDELFNEYSGVGLADLLYFVGIHPDSLPAALQHFGC